MATTLEDLRRDLVGRAKELIEKVGLSVVVDAPNADLDPILAWAAHAAKVKTSGSLALSDADLAAITLSQSYGVLAWAEYRLLATLRNRLTGVDQKVGMGEAKLSQLRDAIDARLKRLEADLGIMTGLQPLTPLTFKRILHETAEEAPE